MIAGCAGGKSERPDLRTGTATVEAKAAAPTQQALL